MRNLLYISILCLAALTSCYWEKASSDSLDDSSDTIIADTAVVATKHYGVGYNFIVHRDSICLIAQQPEEHVSQLETDTITIPRNQHLAVMDIRMIPQDSIDSCWVQLISEEGISGWTRENALLPNVVPTDPISQFIMFFSDSHLLIALCILGVLAVIYFMRMAQKRNVPIVHFRDIPSFYPTLLCLIVACSATFYASLQMFGADQWQHFYYHPSLNPFILPPILAIFIASLWAMLIVGIATIEDVRHHLPFEDALIYLAGLAGVCGVLYVIFSISTLYYVGYLLLILYIRFAIKKYQPLHASHYICGNCGKRLYSKGTCPHCGAVNMCLALALTLALGLTGCSSSDDSSGEGTHSRRTIMVYMNAENNLSSYASNDLQEMVNGSVNLASDCNLLVYYDAMSNPVIYEIKSGSKTALKTYSTDIDSSDKDNMLSVFQTIISLRPADEYATIFWGHGDGPIIANATTNSLASEFADVNAYGADYNSNDPKKYSGVTWIDIPVLASVMKQLPKQKFIFFDACCMQNIEVAYELRSCTDYLIGATCETPSFGAPYATTTPILGWSNVESTAKAIVDDYRGPNNQWASWRQNYSINSVCMSVIKTADIEELLTTTKTALASLYDGIHPLQLTTTFSADYHNANSCIYYYKTDGKRAGYPILYDFNDVMRINLSSNGYELWKAALDRVVIYHPTPEDIRTTNMCDWFGGEHKDSSGRYICCMSTENFKSFYLSDDTFGGVSFFFPMSTYTYYTSPNMNKRMYDYEWCQKVGWEQMGWPQ